MRRFGWVAGLGPPLLLAAGFLAAPTGFAAGAAKVGCGTAFPARGEPIPAEVRLGSVLSARGEVVGRKLVLSWAGGSRAISLAAEAFASEPAGNVVVYGQNEVATGSTVRGVDLQTGCDHALWQSPDVARSAVMSPDLGALYVHLVSQSSRADLGVTRVDLVTRAATNVVGPLPADAAYGPTFATLLRWSLDGEALAVQSCGIATCRIRVLDPTTGKVAAYAGGGEIVGLTRAQIATFQACTDVPCGLSWIDRATGRTTAIDVEALSATLNEDGAGPVLTVRTLAGTKEIRP